MATLRNIVREFIVLEQVIAEMRKCNYSEEELRILVNNLIDEFGHLIACQIRDNIFLTKAERTEIKEDEI